MKTYAVYMKIKFYKVKKNRTNIVDKGIKIYIEIYITILCSKSFNISI